MPPRAASKRAAPAAESQSTSKRAKTPAGTPAETSSGTSSTAPAPAPATATAPKLPKNKRWAAVSNSRNVDDAFRLAVQDVSRASAYICMCKPPFDDDEDDEESDDEDEESDDENEDEDSGDEEEEPKASRNRNGDRAKCDGGKKCLCRKPASEYPDHPWVLTYAGFHKYLSQSTMAAVRCPDNFAMYTYNDHEGYGILEVVQNLLLDWDEAKTWQEQWVVCEGLALFLLDEGTGFYMIDDGEQAAETAQLIGRLFLTMLARLEAENLLDEVSAVKNLGLIMALYIKLASTLRNMSLLDQDDKESVTRPVQFTWVPDRFDNYINAYGTKFGITLRGLGDIDDLTADLDTDASLPPSELSWGWSRHFKSYQKKHARSPPIGRSKSKIGGDSLDITSWTSAERKKYSFDKKDPLSAALLRSIKEGEVLSLG